MSTHNIYFCGKIRKYQCFLFKRTVPYLELCCIVCSGGAFGCQIFTVSMYSISKGDSFMSLPFSIGFGMWYHSCTVHTYEIWFPFDIFEDISGYKSKFNLG